jgi:hypothetical protein
LGAKPQLLVWLKLSNLMSAFAVSPSNVTSHAVGVMPDGCSG